MKFPSLFSKSALIILCLLATGVGVSAQRQGSNGPRQEKLLNGLKLLMWSDPAATDVKVRVRVHSGSAFDPQGKEGLMQLLADNIFPTSAAKAFFVEDLEGSLEVVTNYDYIQINATAKPSEFLTLLDTLSQAVSNPAIDKETTTALKKALSEKLAVLEKDPAYIAEQAAAKRLFGTFPYGRPQMGSVDSLQRIDFADLQFARGRFLAADNATVAISGNFNSDLGFRAARRYLGAWLKSDKRVPSTFRQPDEPDTSPAVIILEGATPGGVYGLRGLRKYDPDYSASLFLERVLSSRLQKNDSKAEVVFNARVLPGMIRIRAAALPPTLFAAKITADEFSLAKSQLSELQRSCETAPNCLAKAEMDRWLDADTYGPPVADPMAFQNVTLADVQRVADRLAKNPMASVIVNPPPRTQ